MRQHGQVLLTFFLVVLILTGVVAYFYYQNFSALGLPKISLPFFQKETSTNTASWKKFTTPDQKISYLYPPDWYLFEDKYVSQYPFNPQVKSHNVVNAISVSMISSQIQTSYANEDWFDKIYRAKSGQEIVNDYHPQDSRIIKVDSGQVKTDQKYAIFTNPFAPNQLIVYVLAKNLIVQLNLQDYDDYGQQAFKKILSTLSITN